MPDVQLLQKIVGIIKEASLAANISEDAKILAKKIREIYPSITLSPHFIDELSTFLQGVSGEDLQKTLAAAGRRTFQRISDHGFDLDKYTQLLAITKLAAVTEGQGTPEIHAYKLCVLFPDVESALAYVRAHQEQTKSSHPFHDACLFDMPEEDTWDISGWQTIFAKYMQDPDFRRSNVVANASRIQQQLLEQNKACLNLPTPSPLLQSLRAQMEETSAQMNKVSDELRVLNREAAELAKQKKEVPEEITQNIRLKREEQAALKKKINIIQMQLKNVEEQIPPLLTQVDSKLILNTARKMVYQNAKQDEVAASLFSKYGMPESVFEQYLKLKHKVKNSDKAIPPIIIEGENYGCPDCFIIKMKADPKSLMLGNITGCCQSLGKEGQGCAIHGYTSPQGGFYVLCKGKPPKDGNTLKILPKDIIAQSWAWRGQDNALVFDSIESQPNMRNTTEYRDKITKMYHALAYELVSQHDTPSIKVGTSGATPGEIGYGESVQPTIPRDYSGYRDSKKQRDIVSINCPLLALLKVDIDKTLMLYAFLPKEMQAEYDEGIILDELCAHGTSAQFDRFLQLIDESKREDLLIESRVLLQALQSKNTALISYLLTQGLGFGKDEIGEALKIALDNKLYLVGEELLSVARENKMSKYELGYWAASFAHQEILDSLLQEGKLDPTFALQTILQQRDNVDLLQKQKECIDLLVTQGADFQVLKTGLGYEQELMSHFLQRYLEKCTHLGMNLTQHDQSGNSLLMHAVRVENADLVSRLLASGASIFEMATNSIGDKVPMLYLALSSKNPEVRRLIFHAWLQEIERIDYADISDESGNTLLMYAVQSDDAELVDDLLAKGANVNVQPDNKKTALHYAAEQGIVDYIEKLLQHGAELELQDSKGNTPLLAAANLSNEEAVRTLLLAGANPKHKNAGSEALFPWRIGNRGNAYFARLEAWEESLLARKENLLSVTDANGYTLLELCAMTNHLSLARKILLHWFESVKADPTKLNEQDPSGKNLFIWAAKIGDVSLLEKLIEAGVNMHAVDKQGKSALHYAALAMHVDAASLLAEKGAQLFLEDNQGSTPFDLLHSKVFNMQQEHDTPLEKKQLATKTELAIGRIIIKAWANEARLKKEINPINSKGISLFVWAAQLGVNEILQDLIGKGVDVMSSAQDAMGENLTALNWAIEKGQIETVDLLLKNGAKPDDQTWNVLIMYPSSEIVKQLHAIQMPQPSESDFRMLNMLWRQAQGTPSLKEVRDYMFEYALSTACRNNNISLLKEYLQKGLQNEISSEILINYLSEAALLGNREVVQVLLEVNKIREALKHDSEQVERLLQEASTPVKRLIEETLKQEVLVKNPFTVEGAQAIEPARSKMVELRANMWEALFNHAKVKEIYPNSEKRNEMVTSLVFRCGYGADENKIKTAIQEVAAGNQAIASVLKEIVGSHMLKVPMRAQLDEPIVSEKPKRK